ncbi:MAG TPA: ABC transporter permease [Bacteroidales bacterium]|nr:ABC transporter permease [Bacteroidales bacterium]
MSKIGLIIQREYLTRVKKKTFVIMTILGPLLFAALMIAPALLAQMEDGELKYVAVIDDSYMFSPITDSTGKVYRQILKDTEYIKFDYLYGMSLDSAKAQLPDSKYYALLYIPHTVVNMEQGEAQLFSYQQPNLGLKMHIANCMEKHLEDVKLIEKGNEFGISQNQIGEILRVVNSSVELYTIKLGEGGKETQSSTEISMILGYIAGFLIYMFVFMYGSQVMRGVIEEKTSRIVEVIVSSVRPFQLMMGKIIGVALVGLTQFLLWVVLTFGLVSIAQAVFIDSVKVENMTQVVPGGTGNTLNDNEQVIDQGAAEFSAMFNSIKAINFPLVLGMFVFYFLGGYLLYAAMFAAIGAAVDNETDTQQFMLPVTIPLVLGIIVMVSAINNPNGSLAYWFSLIPFTSPIVMMVRIPFEVPIQDVIISAGLLIITFIFMVWLAAKIYRTGILMYGKKVNYRELWKWIRYKN